MIKRLLLCLIALPMLAVGCDTATSTLKRAASDMDAIFKGAAKAKVFTGSVLIAKDGVVYLKKGYGQADLENGLPCTPQTKFRIASITKQFTARAVLLLEESGALRIQDRVESYLSPCPDAWKNITIHQLLTHTSGIPDTGITRLENLPSTLNEEIALLRNRPLDFMPGSKWQYSSGGYMLLGAIIEKAAGVTYEDFLRDRIFSPLGMTSTGYDHGGQDLAVSYAKFGVKADVSRVPNYYAAGALYSTVEDLYRWDQAIAADASAQKPYVEKMFTEYAPVGDEGSTHYAYGYGWVLRSTSGRFELFHAGEGPGISAIIARYPKEKLTIIILSNQSSDVSFYAQAVEKAFLGEP
jgi:CubicO group peptidase (beta-lactamase class C family)